MRTRIATICHIQKQDDSEYLRGQTRWTILPRVTTVTQGKCYSLSELQEVFLYFIYRHVTCPGFILRSKHLYFEKYFMAEKICITIQGRIQDFRKGGGGPVTVKY